MDIPTYNPAAVQPMRDELTAVGFAEVFTAEEIKDAIGESGTTLVVVNSVCGCSAGSARPGVCAALQNEVIPDKLVTLFAGQEKTAVAYLRDRYLIGHEPSSPNIILFKDGKLKHFLQRHDIQMHTPEQIANDLSLVFNQECNHPGPSIPTSEYDSLQFTISCGSKIPRMDGQVGSC